LGAGAQKKTGLQTASLPAELLAMDMALAWVGLLGGLLGGIAAIYTAVRYRAIEDYRARLKAEGIEHEVRFTRLHERRMEIIAELYNAITDAERAFNDWTHPLQFAGYPSKDELGKKAALAGKALREEIRKSRIWLDEDLCEQVGTLEQTLNEAWVEFTTYDTNDPTQKAEQMKAWYSAWKSVSQKFPALRQDIERRFRELLGVGSATVAP
jgi:hypothetical protein